MEAKDRTMSNALIIFYILFLWTIKRQLFYKIFIYTYIFIKCISFVWIFQSNWGFHFKLKRLKWFKLASVYFIKCKAIILSISFKAFAKLLVHAVKVKLKVRKIKVVDRMQNMYCEILFIFNDFIDIFAHETSQILKLKIKLIN